eukprot:1106823-Rhodomonas_salina.1
MHTTLCGTRTRPSPLCTWSLPTTASESSRRWHPSTTSLARMGPTYTSARGTSSHATGAQAVPWVQQPCS